MYGEDVPGKVKYYNAGIFVLLGVIYWLTFRIFVLYFILLIDVIWWEFFPYAGVVFVLSYLFYIGPLRKRDQAQTRASGVDFADSLIKKGKIKPQTLMLGFEEVYELAIDFTNDDGLKERLKSQWYNHYLHALTLKQIETNKENQIDTPEKIYTLLEDLTKVIKLENEGQTGNDKEALDHEALIEESKNLGEQAISLLQSKHFKHFKNKTEIIPYETFNIDFLQKDDDNEFRESLKFLGTQNFYYGKLYAKEKFEDETDEWDELIIILPGKYSQILKGHKETTELNGWEVNIKSCFCFWTYWWTVTKQMPVLILNFSDNMTEANIDVFTKMCAKAMAYLELKVMDLWMNDLIVRPEFIIKENTYLHSKANTFENGFSDLIQDQADMDIKYAQFLKDKTQSQLIAKLEKYKRGLIALLCSLLFAIIIGGIIIGVLI